MAFLRHFDSVLELNSGDDLRDHLGATQFLPPLLGALRELEHRRQNARARAAATRLDRAQTNGGDGRFDRVGGSQVNPVLR